MRPVLNTVLLLVCLVIGNQQALRAQTTTLVPGQKAPSLLLETELGSVRTVMFPNENKITLVHFWSPDEESSMLNHGHMLELLNDYKDVKYKEIGGFEIITIALTKNKKQASKLVKGDAQANLYNGFATKGFDDLNVRNYKVTSLPADFLLDENGNILKVNPRMGDIEEVLDAKRKDKVERKNISGKILRSQKQEDAAPGQDVLLMNNYGDTISFYKTDHAGGFRFSNVKLSKPHTIRVVPDSSLREVKDLYLASGNGDILGRMTPSAGGFEYRLLTVDLVQLKETPQEEGPTLDEVAQMSISKNIIFESGSHVLTAQAKTELQSIVLIMQKDTRWYIDITSHTDSRGNDRSNKLLSERRAESVKQYLVTQGIDIGRIRTFGKGESEVRNRCKNGVACSEEEHAENRRTEFRIYKQPRT